MRPSPFLTCFFTAVTLAPLAAQHGSARYELVFTSTWSAATHPVQFPGNAHFSPLVHRSRQRAGCHSRCHCARIAVRSTSRSYGSLLHSTSNSLT